MNTINRIINLFRSDTRGITTILGFCLFTLVFQTGYASAYTMQVQATQKAEQQVEKQFVANELANRQRLVSLELENVSLATALRKLAEEARVGLSFESYAMSEKKVSLNLRNVSVYQALDKLLEGTNLEAVLPSTRNVLVIRQKQELLKVQETVSGTVTDAESGETLPGVNITVKGTTTGTATDANGGYELTVPSLNDTLVFSFVGYQTQEIPISGQSTINVEMSLQAIFGDELVVVGYGTQRKEEITGAVSSIGGEELTQVPTANITNNLSGQIPGLIVVNSEGSPGAGSSISIRGASTFGDNSALIVVDGIVRESFEYIDPNSIESISILKDASATAVYGSRAANGVILVTTKRGRTGRPVFNYNVFAGMQQPTTYPRLLNAYEFATTRNQAVENQGEPSYYTAETIENIKEGNILGTDWYNESLKKQSLQMRHNLNVTGGSDAIKYFMSLSYMDQEGMYDRINFQNYSIRSNVDASINDNLTVSADVNVSRRNHNGSSYSADQIFSDIIGANPIDLAYNPDGTIAYTNEMHPIEQIKTGYDKDRTDVVHTTLNIKQDISFIRGLSAVGKISLGRESTNSKLYDVPIRMDRQDASGNTLEIYSTGGYLGKTAIRQDSYHYNTTTLVARIDYNRMFGDHDVEGFALFEQFEAQSDNFFAFRTNFPADGLEELFYGGEEQKDANGGSFEDARRSFVGKINYGYRQRYLFQASLRIDGSVAFPTTNKYGFFPAISVGWRISEEPFMKDNTNLDFIDHLKIRASYGVIGNDRNVYNGRVPTFQFRQVYNPFGILVSGNSGLKSITPGVLPNPDITWETATNYDLGLDGSLWDDKLQFEVGAFYKRTSDILLSRIRSVPETFGASLPAENYAVVDNKGIELSFTHNNSLGELRYYIGINGSFTRNKVITIDEPANIPEYLRQTGRPLGFIVGYKALGYFQSDEEVANYLPQFSGGQVAGDVKYADINGDGRVDANDQTVLSMDNNTPKIIGGLSFGGSYKGFDLNVLFQGAAKVNRMLQREAITFFLNGSRNTFANLLDYWTPQNQNATYPRPTVGYDPNNTRASNLYLRDTKYIRLKSINLGYTLPTSLLEDLNIEKIRLYVSGSNLFHIDSKLNMFDPEMPPGYGAYYPQQRTFNIGLNFTF